MSLSKMVITALAISTVAGLACCKKTKTPGPQNCSNMVKTIVSTNVSPGFVSPQTTTTNYTYDAQNRLTKITSNFYSYTYTYATGVVNVTYVQSGDSAATNSTLTLNTQGLVLSRFAGDTIYYDNQGEAVREVYPGDTLITLWINGDEVSQRIYAMNGVTVDTFIYSSAVDNRNFGQPYLGKRSTHLLIQQSSGFVGFGSTYTFDGCNRVATAVGVNHNIARDTTTQVYTYY